MRILENSKQTEVVTRIDIPYEEYIALQTELVEQRKRDEISDLVSVMTFSNSVYTTPSPKAPEVIDLDAIILSAQRGGDDTWHGPGQVILAPIVRLVEGLHIREFTELLEAPVRRLLEHYGVVPDQHVEGDFPGIQVDGRKIAQLGLNLDERVTSYGIAFNVTCDLTKFDAIDLCGIEDCAVTNLASETTRDVDLNEVIQLLSKFVEEVFQYQNWVA